MPEGMGPVPCCTLWPKVPAPSANCPEAAEDDGDAEDAAMSNSSKELSRICAHGEELPARPVTATHVERHKEVQQGEGGGGLL